MSSGLCPGDTLYFTGTFVCGLQCEVYIVCTVCNVQCAMYSVQCSVYSVYIVQCAVVSGQNCAVVSV